MMIVLAFQAGNLRRLRRHSRYNGVSYRLLFRISRSVMEHAWSALIIDDDPGVRQSLRLCLEADHARVLGVATASGALDALERSRFDVVFLDLWLQAESGLTVLPEILRRQPGVGVIVVTAYATFESAV